MFVSRIITIFATLNIVRVREGVARNEVKSHKTDDMKNLFKTAVVGVASLIALVSCADAERDSESGILRVKLSTDTSVYTRAESGIVAPEAEAFDLTITSIDGDYTNRWEKLTELTAENKFEVGEYSVKATSGDIENEGFDAPVFVAENSCRIMPSQTALVNLVATLANSGVRVAYTDAFLRYFSEWSVELVSGNGNSFAFGEEESRVAYIAPKPFSIEIDYVKPNGTAGSKSIEVSDVEPRTFYNVRLDVNGGEVGAAKIVVSFDDSVADEKVEIEIDEQ